MKRQQQASCRQAASIEPVAVGISEALRLTGLSKTWLYTQGRTQGIIFIKAGKRTLIDVENLRSVVRSLPRI